MLVWYFCSVFHRQSHPRFIEFQLVTNFLESLLSKLATFRLHHQLHHGFLSYITPRECFGNIAGSPLNYVDGAVDSEDLLVLLEAWGPASDLCRADLDDDGAVEVTDLLLLLSLWGDCPL